MLKDTAERVQNVAPLCGDFAVLCAQEWAFFPRWLFTMIGLLISTSVLAFASAPKMLIQVPRDNLMLWLQVDGTGELLRYIADRPISMVTLIVVTVGVTMFYGKFRDEHDEVRRKLGLIPEHEMTENEKKSVVLTITELNTAIQDQKEWIDKRFVAKDTYEENQRDIRAKLELILKRGARVRKSDNNGDES